MTAPAWLVARPIAHRGFHDAQSGTFENTIAAAEAAIAAGFAVECDVQGTADGEAVVFHDFTLERLTPDTGLVRDRRAADLARLTIGGTADRIPTLGDFLAVAGRRTPVIVEIKSRFDGDFALTDRVASVLSAHEGPVAIKTFDPAILARLRLLAPKIPRGILARASFADAHWPALDSERKHDMANLLHVAETQPDFVSWCVDDLPCAPAHLSRHYGGLPVIAWTVRTPEQRARARAHADQIVFEGFWPQPETLARGGGGA